jgi:hypothetical protein
VSHSAGDQGEQAQPMTGASGSSGQYTTARAEMRAHRAEGRADAVDAETAALRADVEQLREELGFACAAGRLEAEVIESAGLAAEVIDRALRARSG